MISGCKNRLITVKPERAFNLSARVIPWEVYIIFISNEILYDPVETESRKLRDESRP